jgi:hypothetical protein
MACDDAPKDQIIETPFGTWREKPEEELSFISGFNTKTMHNSCRTAHLTRLVRTVADRQETCPTRTDVEVDQREGCTIHVKFCMNMDQICLVVARYRMSFTCGLGVRESDVFNTTGLSVSSCSSNRWTSTGLPAFCCLKLAFPNLVFCYQTSAGGGYYKQSGKDSGRTHRGGNQF